MIRKSFAKVNIFLKITGTKEIDNRLFHTINSRFFLIEELFDTIEFVPAKVDSFTIEGVNIPIKENIIYKAYIALNRYIGDLDILDFFYNHKIVIKKNIPMGAGLGGGSSNAATFINMVNEACNLKRDKDELAKIGATVGADVPFFIYGYKRANVSGIGDIISPFIDKELKVKIFTPNISCNTALVYKTFKENFSNKIDPNGGKDLMQKSSIDILTQYYNNPSFLNDLYQPALMVCPKLKEYQKEGFFLSGSGSSFFTPKI